MPPVLLNTLWTLVSTLCGVFGVAFIPSDSDKAVVAAVAGLAVAVIQWQQHRTIRHHTNAVAAVATAKAQTAKAQNVSMALDQLHCRLALLETERHAEPGTEHPSPR